MIILPILTTYAYTVLFKRLGECTFLNLGVKGLNYLLLLWGRERVGVYSRGCASFSPLSCAGAFVSALRHATRACEIAHENNCVRSCASFQPWSNGTSSSSQLEASYKIKTCIGECPKGTAKSNQLGRNLAIVWLRPRSQLTTTKQLGSSWPGWKTLLELAWVKNFARVGLGEKLCSSWPGWKTLLELGEHLSLIKFKPIRAKWVAKRYPAWAKLKTWLELGVPFGQGFSLRAWGRALVGSGMNVCMRHQTENEGNSHLRIHPSTHLFIQPPMHLFIHSFSRLSIHSSVCSLLLVYWHHDPCLVPRPPAPVGARDARGDESVGTNPRTPTAGATDDAPTRPPVPARAQPADWPQSSQRAVPRGAKTDGVAGPTKWTAQR